MENKIINTIRFLSAEMVLKANSGHQGAPIGQAPMGYVLFNDVMKYNPKNSHWFNRDRFILSSGHASALQYSLLHLYGFNLSMDEIKNFRQLDSQTPGHPEFDETDGVEITTGPLGQGVAMAAGFALAEKHLAAKYNTEEFNLIDHYTYVIAGDGCLMEGVSNEASSLAATMGLDKLILLYDSNNITIDGGTDIAFTEDAKKRYEALGWQTLEVEDGTDVEAIRNAIEEAKADKERPSFIKVNTVIGYGSNKAGTSAVHGNPLSKEDIQEMKENLGYEHMEEFYIADDVKSHLEVVISDHEKYEEEWNAMYEEYKKAYPEKYDSLRRALEDDYDLSFLEDEEFMTFEKDLASRAASGISLNRIAEHIDNLFGGSADLAGSNNTELKGKGYYSKENPENPNIHFGVREHAMAAMANGINTHGGLQPYTATFLSFADYMKPALRLSSLMKQKVINIFTHDSIGLGEDGPTHQAVDQLPMLRAIPNNIVIRPADNRETAAAWAFAIKKNTQPISLILSRQALPSIEGTGMDLVKGGYVVKDFGENPEYLLIGTGSEMHLAYGVAEKLFEQGKSARVVSMPSIELFEAQSEEYKESVMPRTSKNRVAIEASSEKAWYKYLGFDGLLCGMSTFGKSAPAEDAFEFFGFTVEKILKQVEEKF